MERVFFNELPAFVRAFQFPPYLAFEGDPFYCPHISNSSFSLVSMISSCLGRKKHATRPLRHLCILHTGALGAWAFWGNEEETRLIHLDVEIEDRGTRGTLEGKGKGTVAHGEGALRTCMIPKRIVEYWGWGNAPRDGCTGWLPSRDVSRWTGAAAMSSLETHSHEMVSTERVAGRAHERTLRAWPT